MKPYISSKSTKSGAGWRVTYSDGSGPLVSLWGEDRASIHENALSFLDATPEPIDAILQAIAWHGKAAVA